MFRTDRGAAAYPFVVVFLFLFFFFGWNFASFLANNEVTPGGSDRTGAQIEAITLKLLVLRFLPSPAKQRADASPSATP